MESNILLNIDNIFLRYGSKEVLSGINGQVDKSHRIVSFLGPSGCGKTSLLRVLAGLQKPTSGSVTLGGDGPVHAGLVGMVSQNYLLYRNRSVGGNLSIASVQGKRKPEDTKSMAGKFGIDDLLPMYPSQLSGGQRQRVAIAQQLLCSDHYLLMDEPTTGLDPLSKRAVCQLIYDVANESDLNSILLVTHDIRAAISISNTIWMLGRERDANGKVISGTKIMKIHDVAAAGISWGPGVQSTPQFLALEQQILQEFEQL